MARVQAATKVRGDAEYDAIPFQGLDDWLDKAMERAMAMADPDEEFDIAMGYVDADGRLPEEAQAEPEDAEERHRAEQVAVGLDIDDTA